MLIELLKSTPPWAFVFFFALIAVGCFLSKDRTVRRGNVSILPVAMLPLSFYDVVSAFGIVPVTLACWALGIATAVGLGIYLVKPQGVTFSAETQSFFVPGSWFPLACMMAFFFTKYAVGVIQARQLPIARETAFMVSVSICYGLLSGVFLARAIGIWRSAIHHRQNQVSHGASV
jgi:hypothetical protein